MLEQCGLAVNEDYGEKCFESQQILTEFEDFLPSD